MALVAYRADTGEEIESFSVETEVWATYRKQQLGTFRMGRERDIPAIPKRSSRGLQFFAAAPGYGGLTAPESPEHQMAKILLVRGLRAAGFDARVEQPGETPTGERWEADVYVETPTKKIAIEVQLSQQHWDDYRRRTERYAASGVETIWLVRSTHVKAFHKARYLFLTKSMGMDRKSAVAHEPADMPFFVLLLADKVPDSQVAMHVVVHPKGRTGPGDRLTLEAFGAGVGQGAVVLGERSHPDGSNRHQAWLWTGPAGSPLGTAMQGLPP